MEVSAFYDGIHSFGIASTSCFPNDVARMDGNRKNVPFGVPSEWITSHVKRKLRCNQEAMRR